jgi:hypothetical protein
VASTGYVTDNVFGVNPSTATITGLGTATGQGTNNLSSYSYIGPVAAASPGFTWAESLSSVKAAFDVTANGVVKFNIPWQISYYLSTTAGTGSYSHGISSISATLTRYAINGKTISQDTVEYISDTNDLVGDLKNSKDNFAAYLKSSFLAGEKGQIEFIVKTQVDAASAVPIPAGLWLLGSGLVGLVGIRRKSLKK